MKVIVPMAGMGKRMRPHTLTIPKPLLPIAGKPIVQRLVEEIAKVSKDQIEEIAFIIGDFGAEVEETLKNIAADLGAKARICYQTEALGTAHAIYCAKESLEGKVVVAFADTLFKADFELDEDIDGSIWVKKIEDPSAFGVVKLNNDGVITDFVEKPKEFVSDLAIIGIYYFKEGEVLRDEIQHIIDNKIIAGGEYQLTTALENMKAKGKIFKPGEVGEWMDCGNKDNTVFTNQRTLEYLKDEKLIADSAQVINSVVIPPCYIGDNVKIENAVVGPHLSVGADSVITNSVVKNSIIQTNTKLTGTNIENSMIGSFVEINEKGSDMSIGDYTTISK